MSTYQQLAAATERLINRYGPNDAPGVAELFAPHDKCEAVTSIDDEFAGVIERNDGELMTITFDFDDRYQVTGWRFATYGNNRDLEDSDAYHTGGSTGTLDDIAWDITETVTDWLDESFQPARFTNNLALHALAYTLEDEDFNTVSVEDNAVVVTHVNDFSMRITPEYSDDGIQHYLKCYKCEVLNPEGGSALEAYDDLDELVDALRRQEAIDEDEIKQEFAEQVNELFSNDVWRLDQSWLIDMIAHWGPVDRDEDEDRYRGKVDAMGIQEVHLGPFGQIEAVEMLAMGDFYGEETAVLRGSDLVGKAAAWLTEEMDSCGVNARGR